MTKPVFKMALRGGQFKEVAYSPLMFTAGSVTYKLALAKNEAGDWVVSDPKSGGKVVTVDGVYKGVPCSSRGFPITLARQFAMASLEVLLNRIGSEKFNAVLAEPKLK
jgi:hypothetical protein